MLRFEQQIRMSDFEGLYDRLIPKNHFFRQMNGLVDFTFVYDELEDKYCLNDGREAVNPIIMFKYLLLKVMHNLSDGDLVERCLYDMSFKYFLGISPEDNVIDSSSLSKFRKLRLTDEGLLDLLLGKTVDIAKRKGLLKGKKIIIDSTHTTSRYNHVSPAEALREHAKDLRILVYSIDESKKNDLPEKTAGETLDTQIEYCKKLLEAIEEDERLLFYPPIREKLNFLHEMIDDNLESIRLSPDEDARVGHKSADTEFFGYKTHMAMSEEGIITAATVTSGEKADGKELAALVEKTRNAGMDIDTVIGDSAYSIKENLEYAEDNFTLVSKLSSCVTHGIRKDEDRFEYNKDAGMYVCKSGHMATSKTMRHNKQEFRRENPRMVYYFDIEKCKHCPLREGCYKEGSKSKSYSVTITSGIQCAQAKFQETEAFKKQAKERYKIEAKNSEIKNRHGYDVSNSSGIHAMEIQGATTLFMVNMKKIIRMMGK